MKPQKIRVKSSESNLLEKSVLQIIPESGAIWLTQLPVKPLVSVLITNHNYGRYLDDAIRNVRAQTYQTFEIIICDDGSNDNSEEVYQRYSKDRRIRIIRQEHGGQGKAITRIFNVSRGKIICFLDADDFFHPLKLELTVDAFLTHPQAGICAHFLQPVSKIGRALGKRIPRSLDSGWLATEALGTGGYIHSSPTSGLSIRREIGDHIFPIPDGFTRRCDAYINGISVFLTKFVAIPEILSYYRWHGKNIDGGKVLSYASIAEYIEFHNVVFQEQQNLLKRRFSAEIADHFVLDNSTDYSYMQLWLHIFAGKRLGRLNDMHVKEIENRLPKTFKNLIRRVLLRLPSTVSRSLIKLAYKTVILVRIICRSEIK